MRLWCPLAGITVGSDDLRAAVTGTGQGGPVRPKPKARGSYRPMSTTSEAAETRESAMTLIAESVIENLDEAIVQLRES